jgi:inner membrane protein
MGVKLIVVCGLALLMTIPSFFVWGLVNDRTKRADDVVKEISGHVGGPQTFLGPTLAIPYSIPAQSLVDSTKHGIYLVFPTQAYGVLKSATEERHRSSETSPRSAATSKRFASSLGYRCFRLT